jgi:imidazolonepropionase
MTATLVTGISELVTNDPTLAGADHREHLGLVRDAALIVDAGRVAWVGAAVAAAPADVRLDVGGRAVIPGFVDSHTHLVFAGDRADEFAARMAGSAYDGGGIAGTVAATREASDDELRSLLAARVAEMRAQGTTTVEMKSGYGLTVSDEARALRIAGEFTPETTYLGAHVVPAAFAGRRGEYLAQVVGPMLAACAPYARWIDVFCEPNSPHAFREDEAREVLIAGAAAGLLPRVHGNQLGYGPGVQLAVSVAAASVDHCTYLDDADVDALVGARDTTVATVLPGVDFSTRSPYADARRLLDAGARVALASDANPGTCYSTSIPFVIALAVREMHLTPAEALFAATAGGARALRRDDVGHLAVGARADLCVLEAPSHLHLAYRPGMCLAKVLDLGAELDSTSPPP